MDWTTLPDPEDPKFHEKLRAWMTLNDCIGDQLAAALLTSKSQISRYVTRDEKRRQVPKHAVKRRYLALRSGGIPAVKALARAELEAKIAGE